MARGKHGSSADARRAREAETHRADVAERRLAAAERDLTDLLNRYDALRDLYKRETQTLRDEVAAGEGDALRASLAENDRIRDDRAKVQKELDDLRAVYDKIIDWLIERLRADLNLTAVEGMELFGWKFVEGWHSRVHDPTTHVADRERDDLVRIRRIEAARGRRPDRDLEEIAANIRLMILDGKIRFTFLPPTESEQA